LTQESSKFTISLETLKSVQGDKLTVSF